MCKICPSGAIEGKVREAHTIIQDKCVKCVYVWKNVVSSNRNTLDGRSD